MKKVLVLKISCDMDDDKSSIGLLQKEDVPRLYPIRWLMLLIYFFLTVSNASCFITFGPIDVTSAAFFEQSAIAVNLASALGTIYSVFLMFPCIYLVKRFGLRKSMLFCAVTNMIMGVTRLIAPFLPVSRGVYFWFIFGGQVIGMLANPYVSSLVPEVSSRWFGVSERTIATSVGSLATLTGLATGFSLSGFIIGNDANSPVSSLQLPFQWLFVSQGVFAVVTGIAALFFQGHPPTPPSTTTMEQNNMSLWEEVKSCMRERNFVLLFTMLSVGYGCFVALWTVMQSIVGLASTAAWIGNAMVGAGIVASGVSGTIIDKWRIYRPVLIIGAIGGLGGLVLFYLGLSFYFTNEAWLIGSGAMTGFFLISLLPVAFETAVELTYPVNETTSAGILIMGGNAVAIIFVILFSVVTEINWVTLSAVVTYGVACIIILFFKPHYKRLEEENRKKQAGLNA